MGFQNLSLPSFEPWMIILGDPVSDRFRHRQPAPDTRIPCIDFVPSYPEVSRSRDGIQEMVQGTHGDTWKPASWCTWWACAWRASNKLVMIGSPIPHDHHHASLVCWIHGDQWTKRIVSQLEKRVQNSNCYSRSQWWEEPVAQYPPFSHQFPPISTPSCF